MEIQQLLHIIDNGLVHDWQFQPVSFTDVIFRPKLVAVQNFQAGPAQVRVDEHLEQIFRIVAIEHSVAQCAVYLKHGYNIKSQY